MGLLNYFLTAHTLLTEQERIHSLPFRLTIEPTTRCNLECRMCCHSERQRPKKDLTFEDFLKIIESFPNLTDLRLQGVGEPLLNPDIFRMIAHAKAKRIRVGLFTNATLINEDMAGEIVSSGLDWMNLSLDAASPHAYESIRRGAKFNEVIKNIIRLMELRKRRANTTRVCLWFTGMKMNILELPAIIRLAKELGIEEVTAQGAHSWGNDFCRESLKGESLLEHSQLTRKVFIQAAKEAKKLKIRLDFRPRYFEGRAKRVCRWPWLSCFITVDGLVAPCCVQGSDPEVISFGNIFEKRGFQDIWNSAQYQGFRRELKSKCLPRTCQDCPGYYYK